MKRGLHIAIEGCDGAGTTTQRDRLVRRLDDRKVKVHPTAQPSQLPIGTFIRGLLQGRNKVDVEALQRLFVADRVDHLARIVEPARNDGAHVICDRSELSTAIYYAAGVPEEEETDALIKAYEWHQGIEAPTLTVILVVPAEVAAARRATRPGAPELFEKAEFQARVARLYAEEAKLCARDKYSPWRQILNSFYVAPWLASVDGTGSPEEVESRVWAIVEQVIR